MNQTMRRVRALLAAFITICGLLLGSIDVTAAGVQGMEILTDDTAVRKGQEITLTFALKGYEEIGEGVNAFKGTLEFDSDVFEKADGEDFAALNSWERLYYNPDNGQFVLINRAGSMEDEAVFSLRLKAKESIPAKEALITVKDLSVSEGKEDLYPADGFLKIDSITVETPGEAETETQELELGPVRTGDPWIGNVIFTVILIAAFLIAVLLFIFRRKKDAEKKKERSPGGKKILTGVLVCGLTSAAILGSVSAYAGKSDLNDDGNIDYSDVELLQKHLIALKILDKDGQKRADMNSDGKLTVTDLSMLIRRIEKKADYEVHISSAMERFYYEKHEQAELNFYAEVSCGLQDPCEDTIESVIINGTEYEAARREDSQVYTVTADTGDRSGVKEYHITKAILDNGQEVSVDYTEQIDVLKSAPEVMDFHAEEMTDAAQMKVSFVLKDDDSALSMSQMKVVRQPDSSLFMEKDLRAGKNEFTLDLEEGTAYDIHITAAYNRDSDELEVEEDHTGTFSVSKEIQLNIDYQFRFGSMKVKTADGVQTDRFSRNQPVMLAFETGNSTVYEPEQLIVNGVSYPVSRTENGEAEEYYVMLDGFAEHGEAQIRAEKLILSNGKTFDLGADQAVDVMILKALPEAEGLEIQEDTENGVFRVKFHLSDPDSALSGHKAEIQNSAGQTVAEMEFKESDLPEDDQKKKVFDKEIPLADTGLTAAYTVRIKADCDLTADKTETERQKVLAEKTVAAKPRILIAGSRTDRSYVEKGGSVNLYYELSHNVDAEISALVVNNRELTVRSGQTGIWEVEEAAPEEAGVHAFSLSQAVFADGTTVRVSGETTVEVLKDTPAVNEFTWNRTSQDELEVRFKLADKDGALQDAIVQITEKDGSVLVSETVSSGENKVSAPLSIKENYVVTVTADYDRDTNTLDDQSNAFTGELLYTENITVSKDSIELKDITDTTLYYAGDGTPAEVDILDITGGLPDDVENYYAFIEMESMPDFYAGIRSFWQDEDTGRVYAELDQNDLVSCEIDGTKNAGYAFPLVYRDDDGEHPLIRSAEELFRRMAADPKGRHELTEDLDASGVSTDAAAAAGTFTGELDGNGHTIYNLPTSLFGTLSGARIHDLVIEDAAVTVSRSGILANVIQNGSVIENVFITDSSISNGVDGLGTFTGRLVNSTIRKSASVNVSVKGLVAVGGIAGKTESGSLIENCYVTGKVQGTYDHPSLGARTGGISGWHGGGRISRCYTRAQIIAPALKGNGGIIGGPNTGAPDIRYSLSMSSGAGYRIAGFDVLDDVTEVYEFSGSDSISNITEDNQDNVKETDAVYDKKIYTDTLGFDDGIWELNGLAYEKLPSLKDAPMEENNYGIPNYTNVLKHEKYRPEREKAYSNMAKMMPLADTRMWVEYGNLLSDEDLFAAKIVDFVLPLNADNSIISGIRRDNPGEVEKIRVVFDDGTMQEYPVAFDKLVGGLAAVYQVDGLELKYQFHNYASDIDAAFLAETAQMASAYDYAADMGALTPEEESRLYTDYYNESVNGRMEDLLYRLFASGDQYPTYCNNPAVRALAAERMRDEGMLKRMLYAYNYYDKWYRIDYAGVLLSDLMFFNGEMLADGMTAEALTSHLLSAGNGQRDTNRTINFYNNVLKNYTGKPLTDFLGGLAGSIAGYSDANDWFADSFDGLLVEKEAQGDEGKIRYRMWDNLSGLEDGRKSIVLHILTAPQEDMYLISVPSQFIIGSMNRYPDYLNKDGQELERMRRTAEAYAEKMGIFYGVSSQWMDGAEKQLNSFVNIQYDTRLSFPESNAASAGAQEKGQTRDPVMKWVYEANEMLNALNGSAAVADGRIVIWMWSEALGTSDYTFFTFSHETAHNQDGRYFYGGAGRRNGTGAEAHADGNIAQEMRDGAMVFNISKNMDIGTEMTNNFSYERINSKEKIHSYYREMFETGYVLDYLAAQAFLKLTPQQQAAVAVQAEHTPGGTSSMSTVYKELTAEEFAAMDLKNMKDLWENRISVRNAASYPERVGTATNGSYGFESFYTMNWYQSHNDDGSPDTHSFKRLGQEMLGLAGYEKGYMIYMSGLSENDLDALQKITGNPDITWKEYKLGRYRAVEEKLAQIPYFNPDTVIEQFKAAFEQDAAGGNRSACIETKRMLYGMVKRVTGDFSDGSIYKSPNVVTVATAEELIRHAEQNPYGYYRLENDIDFSRITASGGSYIPGRFIGVLDGNGKKLTGMQYPLFGDLQYGLVKDLTIQDPSYEADAQALLAVKTKKVTLGNVCVEGADMSLPLVRTKNEGYYEYGDMTVTIGEKKITTPEELLAIGESPAALKKKYILEADIDLSGAAAGSFAVPGTFSGELDGNGFTLSGLNAVLFEKLDGAQVSDVVIEGTTLTSNAQKGALANEIKNSVIENVQVRNLTIKNNTNQVGGLAGLISGSTVKRISAENISIKASDTIGGIAGQFDGTILSDCVVTGEIEGTIRHPMGTRIGGMTGWLGNGIIRNCIAKIEITAPDRTGNGGLIGGPQNGNVTVESSVSLSTGANANRISGWDVLGTASSAYELDSSDSKSNINETNAGRIFPVSQQQAAEKAFYLETLGWSEEVWDFDGLAAGGMPELRR